MFVLEGLMNNDNKDKGIGTSQIKFYEIALFAYFKAKWHSTLMQLKTHHASWFAPSAHFPLFVGSAVASQIIGSYTH